MSNAATAVIILMLAQLGVLLLIDTALNRIGAAIEKLEKHNSCCDKLKVRSDDDTPW